jgi:hypothetical protein
VDHLWSGLVSRNDRKGIGTLRHHRDGGFCDPASLIGPFTRVSHTGYGLNMGFAGEFEVFGIGNEDDRSHLFIGTETEPLHFTIGALSGGTDAQGEVTGPFALRPANER